MSYTPDFEKLMDKYGRLFVHIVQKFEPEVREEAAKGIGETDKPSPLDLKLSTIVATVFALGYSEAMKNNYKVPKKD